MKPHESGVAQRAALWGVLVSLLWTLPAGAQGPAAVPAAVSLGPGSALWLEGTSTVHDYESRTTQPSVKLLRDASATDPADVAALDRWLRAGGLRGLDLVVPLATMHSKRGEALDKNMLKALKAAEHPEITFHVTAHHLAAPHLGAAAGDTLAVTADGVLRVAGAERAITVAGRLVRAAAGVWLEGEHGLRMSDYGVKPPTMMLGTLKVRDPVSIHFKLLLTPSSSPPAPSQIPIPEERSTP